MANQKWYGWTGRILRVTGLLIGLELMALGGGSFVSTEIYLGE